MLGKEYEERLRERPTHPNQIDHFKLKEISFNMKLNKGKQNVSQKWDMRDLDAVLKDIDKNKNLLFK